jgi:hypothetical protein
MGRAEKLTKTLLFVSFSIISMIFFLKKIVHLIFFSIFAAIIITKSMANIGTKTILLLVLTTVWDGVECIAQPLSVRNNLIYDATLTPNIGVEWALDSKWSIGANAGINAWDIDKQKNKKLRHLLIAPELRHWNDSIYKHRSSFWGLDLIYSHYNVGNITFPFGLYKTVRDHRLQGDLAAIGAFYGYNWRLSKWLRLEAEVGLGVGYAWSKKYDCPHCGTYLGRDNKPFLVPKLGLNIVLNKARKAETPVVPMMPVAPEIEEAPVLFAIHDVADNTGRAGMLQTDNPVLEHISKYRPYDRTRILRKEKGALYVHFPVGKSILDENFRDNAATLGRIVDITRQVMADTTSTVKCIQIIGLASIEGPVDANEALATARAEALKEYLQQHVSTPAASVSSAASPSSAAVTVGSGLPAAIFDVVGGGEAWSDFRDLIAEAATRDGKTAAHETAAHETAALAIIDGTPDADARERLLRSHDGGSTWCYISEHILPELRNSGYIRIYYDYVPDTAAAAINRASELLRTDCDDCHRQALHILTQLRHDERAQNALGVALYLCGRHDEALDCFRRAAANGNSDAQTNLRELERRRK